MRSRYSAFAIGNTEYVGVTWHYSTRPKRFVLPAGEWLQLRVLAAQTIGERATVEFVAKSRIEGRVSALHEVSRFVREGGCWFYVDGDVLEG